MEEKATVLRVRRLRPDAVLPARATPGSAGYDLCACLDEELTVHPGEIVKVSTGLAVELSGNGYAAMIYPRSGLASRYGLTLANCVGVVDSDYRGEVCVAMINLGTKAYAIQSGERIAQLVVTPVALPTVEEVAALSDTVRGTGGFGSTGK